ncbi:MAG: VOC family protein [Actinomycetota bacterium]
MTTIAAITMDCTDALTLARFWSAVLDRPIDEGEPAPSAFFARIAGGPGPSGGPPAPTMMFIQVGEAKTAKNRVHLDLQTDDREGEVARLIALGATHVHDKDEWGTRWTTLTDPEGNEFCIAQH